MRYAYFNGYLTKTALGPGFHAFKDGEHYESFEDYSEMIEELGNTCERHSADYFGIAPTPTVAERVTVQRGDLEITLARTGPSAMWQATCKRAGWLVGEFTYQSAASLSLEDAADAALSHLNMGV